MGYSETALDNIKAITQALQTFLDRQAEIHSDYCFDLHAQPLPNNSSRIIAETRLETTLADFNDVASALVQRDKLPPDLQKTKLLPETPDTEQLFEIAMRQACHKAPQGYPYSVENLVNIGSNAESYLSRIAPAKLLTHIRAARQNYVI